MGALDPLKRLTKGWSTITRNKIRCPVRCYLRHLSEPSESSDLSQRLYSKCKRLGKKVQGQKAIDEDGFSMTIRSEHHGNIEFRRHGGENERRLTLRECGLIQTFPPEFVFSTGHHCSEYKYIGNAVPPLLGYLIADKIYQNW